MESMSSWEWKQEPASPPQLYEDVWLFDDDTATTIEDLTALKHLELTADVIKHENKAEIVSRLLDDLEQLDQLDNEFIKEEEPFANWLEEKVEIPIFENIRLDLDYAPAPNRFKSEELKVTPPPQHQQDTSALLQEFETVFDAVELTHGQLTPPQSPPLAPQLTTLTPISSSAFLLPPQQVYYQPERINYPQRINYSEIRAPATPVPDVAKELAVVDELVRSRAENLVVSWEEASPSSPSSTSGYSECSSDPEWTPQNPERSPKETNSDRQIKSRRESNCSTNSSEQSDSEWIPEPVHSGGGPERSSRGRKRAGGKPYGTEDKKSRKKEQNKNAATRYRMKKKAEVEVILSEEKGLQDFNDDMQGKVTDLQREIKYLKGLMRDLFKAKGLIQ